MTSNILDSYNKQLEEQQQGECLKSRSGDHDFESINFQQISRNIVEVEYVCLECGNVKYVYNYIEDSEIDL